MFKFQIGDEIQISAGRDKGKKGKIQKIHLKENRLTVSGVNIYKRHKKATRSQGSGIFEVTRPINVANVRIICPKCGKPTKVGFNLRGKTKERICKNCKGVINIKKD